jgi:hypothetical protein
MGKELSFSGYTQRVVVTNLTKALCKGDFDNSCMWSIEMHISGWIETWWYEIVFFAATYFNCNNPKISIFLWDIINDYPGVRGIGDTNCGNIRQIVALITGACAFSPKDIPFQIPKPIAVSDTDAQTIIRTIDKAPLNNYAVKSALKDDLPFSIRLFSQLIICIQKNNFHGALRYISISLYIQKNQNKELRKLLICARRMWKGLDKKLWNWWGLYLMDILCDLATDKEEIVTKIIKSWRALMIVNYTSTKDEKKLIAYIINVIGLLTNKIKLDNPCIRNEQIIHTKCGNIDTLYKGLFNKSLKNDTASNGINNKTL